MKVVFFVLRKPQVVFGLVGTEINIQAKVDGWVQEVKPVSQAEIKEILFKLPEYAR